MFGFGTSAKLTEPNPPSSFHDRHDLHERPAQTQIYQRQQHQPRLPHAPQTQTPPPTVPEQSTTPSSHHRALRRTPRFTATPSPKPQDPSAQQPSSARVTLTLGPRGKFVLADQQQSQSGQRQTRTRPRPARRQLSQELSSEDDEDHEPLPRAPSQYHRDTTNPPGPDLPDPHPAVRISKRTHSAILYALEETLRGPKELSNDWVEELASMSDLLGGGIATTNGNGASSSRPVPARAPHGSPSGIRGPRMIMQERQAREAARKEERERQEREHAENEAHMLDEARRRDAERRAAAGTGAGSSAIPTDPNVSRRPAGTTAASGRVPTNPGTRTGDLPGGAEVETPRRHHRTSSNAAPAQAPSAPTGGATAGNAPKTQQGSGSDSLTAIGRGRNSFPHAFERWETLSAHWEGLTSFWIRRLQQNSEEINQDPLSQQLSRQVTDLSSAGANLFHAVVELQRLRASSERKFQRWFFETRAEMERNQEVTAMLEAALEEERRSRADAVREALENAQGSSKVQKQLSEMRKELQISKEEARRAWEELGRREQEERDRTASLQLGHPTIVGGVQVVPMTQGVSRHNSQRDPQQYGQADPSDYSRGQASRPDYTQAPAVQPVAASAGEAAYQQPPAVHHQDSYGSEGTFSEEEFETPATQPGVPYPPSSGQQQPAYASEPDYTGASWEQTPRHHHPTRLSDVIEEDDERSRTSASHSQVSRG
ncbi:uncharacterized protein PG998_012568 [Apiospora kogelbergensis]|uniref:uncharacterized protein n=1 Tax=Apiospora kogelbergensis TaxID=1337665 RepID=UPI00312D923F